MSISARWAALAVLPLLTLGAAGAAFADNTVTMVGRWAVWPVVTEGAQTSCMARLPNPNVDLILMINENDKLVLTAGHPGWEASGGQVQTTLAIDSGAPAQVAAFGIGPTYMALMPDAVTAALRQGHTIKWSLPPGTYRLSIDGLAAAMDQVRTCEKPH